MDIWLSERLPAQTVTGSAPSASAQADILDPVGEWFAA
jgi:hypothetical protein